MKGTITLAFVFLIFILIVRFECLRKSGMLKKVNMLDNSTTNYKYSNASKSDSKSNSNNPKNDRKYKNKQSNITHDIISNSNLTNYTNPYPIKINQSTKSEIELILTPVLYV